MLPYAGDCCGGGGGAGGDVVDRISLLHSGTFMILSVAFYLTIFDPRRDMILEEEYEYAICTEADEDKLALRLQNYLRLRECSQDFDRLATPL